MKGWVFVGAGPQGRISIEAAKLASPQVPLLLVDDAPHLQGQQLLGVPIVAREEFVQRADRDDWRILICLGRNELRLRLGEWFVQHGCRLGILIHPSATVFASATIGEGSFIAAGAIVGSGAVLHPGTLVNTRAVVEHDCVLEAGANLAPGVVMAGRVRVGTSAFVGTGAVLNPRVHIGARAIIGAGAVVTKDVPADSLAYGVPARVIRPVNPSTDWDRLM